MRIVKTLKGYGVPALAGSAGKSFGNPELSSALEGTETRPAKAGTPYFFDPRSGFTMIEIAISLAVIGFALVAIIGILPQGMTVQKENRQETIINQDNYMFMEAIRNGGKGFDDLTNYVSAITNYWTVYSTTAKPTSGIDSSTYTNAFANGVRVGYEITNGLRIVGFLSTPRYVDTSRPNVTSFQSNYIVAYVRSMSGQAGEKFPQTNPSMLDLAFGYRLMPEIAPYSNFEPDWTNYTAYTDTNKWPVNAWVTRSNYWRVASTMQTNLCDLRLTFRWPAFPNGKVGNDRQIFRTAAGGHLLRTNNFGMPVYFFEPRTYVKAKLP
jgi:prepilin-type N-terminal cleavage/methylation domain-containing protein